MKSLLKILMILGLLLFSSCRNEENENISDESSQPRPNFIFIMTDDHAKNAISAYGSELINTPNIDKLASEGILFNNFFVTNAICAPSRAVMLTGKYSHINGVMDNRDKFDSSQVTFPKILRERGYYTAMIGKWHLKSEPAGFDYWKILPGQGAYYNPQFIEMGDTVDYEGYVTDLITDFTIGALEGRDKDKPFSLFYHHKAPHRNWMPSLSHLDLLNEIDIPVPENFFDNYKNRRAASEQDMEIRNLWKTYDLKLDAPEIEEDGSGGSKSFDAPDAWEKTLESLTPKQREKWDKHYNSENKPFLDGSLSGDSLALFKYQRYIKDYLRCIISVDQNIGRLIDYLTYNNLLDNTIIIYTSDQGFYLGEHGWYDKRFMYEESFSAPLIIRYPKEITPGAISNSLTTNLDFAPTFLDIAGINIPLDMQGSSLRPLFEGSEPPNWRKSVYYHYYEYPHGWHNVHKHNGIRNSKYKLIHFYENENDWEFYDLENDPKEMNNLINSEFYKNDIENMKMELIKQQEFYKDNF